MLDKITNLIKSCLLFLILLLTSLYFLALFYTSRYSTPITLTFIPNLTCSTVPTTILSKGRFFGYQTHTTALASTAQTPVSLTLAPFTRTVTLSFCKDQNLLLTDIKLIQGAKTINISSQDSSHLLYLSTPGSVQIGGLEALQGYFYRSTLRYTNRLPQLVLLLCLILIVLYQVPLTFFNLLILCVTAVLSLTTIIFWSKISHLFPYATSGPNQIIAAAQYYGFSTTADTIIFIIYLSVITILVLGLKYATRQSQKLN